MHNLTLTVNDKIIFIKDLMKFNFVSLNSLSVVVVVFNGYGTLRYKPSVRQIRSVLRQRFLVAVNSFER